MNAYCPHCGGITEYTLTKPNFCASCGKDMRIAVGTAARPSPTLTVATPPPRNNEEEEIIEVPHIAKAQVEIVVEKPRGVKFGQVFATNTGGTPSIGNRPAVVTDPKKAAEMIQAETKPTVRGGSVEE